VDPDLWILLLGILFLILLRAFFAASENAMVSLRQARIRQLMDEGNNAAMAIDRLLKASSHYPTTIQFGITMAGFLASAAAVVILSDRLTGLLDNFPVPFIALASQEIAVLIIIAIVSYITLVFGELVPKRMAQQKAEQVALFSALPIELLSKVFYPFTLLLEVSANAVVRLLGGAVAPNEPEITEDELRLMVAEQVSLEEEEKQMIDGIFEFGDNIARQVMTPRIDITGVKEGSPIAETISLMIETGFSRLPVYRESLDHIIGQVYLKDLLAVQSTGRVQESIGGYTRSISFVPERKNLLELLREMRKANQHMVIISDEYGGTAGLVTIEDLLEEIVGEIKDEEDNEPCPVEYLNEDEYLVDARLSVEEVNAALNADLPVEDAYETLGGLLLKELGKIPDKGDQFELFHMLIAAEKIEGNRIIQIRVKKRHNKMTPRAS